MAFVSDFSCECISSELDLFMVPPTQTSIQQAEWVEYQQLTSILGNAAIEFNVIGSGEEYVDLSNVMLYVRAKIVKKTTQSCRIHLPPRPSIFCFTVCSVRSTYLSTVH